MQCPVFFPSPRLATKVDARGAITVAKLLARAGAPVNATGPSTKRRVVLARGETTTVKEPGDWSPVRIGVPAELSDEDAARYGCLVMAYSIFDHVVRVSIRGLPWTRPSLPRGRPSTGKAQTGAERQRRFRRHANAKREHGSARE